MRNGFWNGVEPVKWEVVEYEVLQPDIPTWWMTRFVGTIRQGILIKYENHEFLIDNQFGDGWCKMAVNGSPSASHRSIDNYRITSEEVPMEKVIFRLDIEGIKKDHEDHMEFLRINYPASYEKLKALEARLKEFKNNH